MDPRAGRIAEYDPVDENDEDECVVEYIEIERVAPSADEFEDVGVDSEVSDVDTTRAQIGRTRAEISDTIDALKEKLNPQRLMEQAKETVREATIGRAQQAMSNAVDTAKETVGTAMDTAKEAAGTAVDRTKQVMSSAVDTAREAAGTAADRTKRVVSSASDTVVGVSSTVSDTVRRDPLPVALAGIGIGWLLISARKRAQEQQWNQDGRYRDPYLDFREESASGSAALPQAFAQVQSKVGEIAGQAQEKVGEMVSQVQSQASQLSSQAELRARQAVDGYERMFMENPLGVGAVALALGVALGLSVPETQPERRMLGGVRDNLVVKAKETAQEIGQKVQSVAQEAIDAAKEEARTQGLTTA